MKDRLSIVFLGIERGTQYLGSKHYLLRSPSPPRISQSPTPTLEDDNPLLLKPRMETPVEIPLLQGGKRLPPPVHRRSHSRSRSGRACHHATTTPTGRSRSSRAPRGNGNGMPGEPLHMPSDVLHPGVPVREPGAAEGTARARGRVAEALAAAFLRDGYEGVFALLCGGGVGGGGRADG